MRRWAILKYRSRRFLAVLKLKRLINIYELTRIMYELIQIAPFVTFVLSIIRNSQMNPIPLFFQKLLRNFKPDYYGFYTS